MAYQFDVADSDFIHWGDSISEENGDLTVYVRVYPTTSNTGYTAAHWGGSNGWGIRRNSSDPSKYTAFINNASGGNSASTAASTVTLNEWQDLVFTMSDSGSDGTCVITLHVDGVQAAQSTTADRINAVAAPVGVGNRIDGTRDFSGGIAEFAVWVGSVLSGSQISALCDAYSPLSLSVLPDLYAPMINNISDISGGLAGTNVNAAGTFTHPRIMGRVATSSFFPAPAAVGGSLLLINRSIANIGGMRS